MKHIATTLIRFTLQLLGVLCVLIGGLTFPLPLPVGLLLIAGGFTLLASTSLAFRRFIQARRLHNPRLHRFLDQAETKLPSPFSRILSETRPIT